MTHSNSMQIESDNQQPDTHPIVTRITIKMNMIKKKGKKEKIFMINLPTQAEQIFFLQFAKSGFYLRRPAVKKLIYTGLCS